jgi:3-methyl-2-oxobutanoate hydroxymethyltransferase
MTKDKRITIPDIKAFKNGPQPLVCLTAYTAPMARILDQHVDLMLVGDSIGMVLYGMENTLGVTIEMMIAHGQAVMREAKRACVIVDMPFGSYEESPEQAYRSAARIMKETGCDGVKLEGGTDMETTIRHLTSRNIPVMGHIGLQPQSVVKDGGYKIKGRTQSQIKQLMDDAKAVERAGAFAVVIEGTIEDVAAKLTRSVGIPTIGIGASSACDGQILVTEDMIGLSTAHRPKFVKAYKDLGQEVAQAVSAYTSDVRARKFPAAEHTYTAPRPVPVKDQA